MWKCEGGTGWPIRCDGWHWWSWYFSMFKKVGGTSPRTAPSGKLWALDPCRPEGTEGVHAFKTQLLRAKRETHTSFICCLCLPWDFDQVTFGGLLGLQYLFMSCRLATWGSWACTVQLAGPFKLIDFKCSSSAPFLTSTPWHSLRSPVAVAFAELCWWPCACAAFGHFVLWWFLMGRWFSSFATNHSSTCLCLIVFVFEGRDRERERELLLFYAIAKYFEDHLRFLAHEWIWLSCKGFQYDSMRLFIEQGERVQNQHLDIFSADLTFPDWIISRKLWNFERKLPYTGETLRTRKTKSV